MVMVADLGTAHTAEKFLCPIRASAVEAVSLFVIDTLHFEAAMKLIPVSRFVGADDSALRNPSLDERESMFLGTEHGRQGVAAALANHDHGLTLAGLIELEATIAAMLGKVGRF